MKPLSWAVSVLALIGLWTVIHELRRVGWGLERRRRFPEASILLLVRDQADRLEALLRPLLDPDAFGWRCPFRYEVVVVDAGSRDESLAVLQRLARSHPGLCLEAPPAWGPDDPDPLLLGYGRCRHPVVILLDLRAPGHADVARAFLAALGGVQPPEIPRGGSDRAPLPSRSPAW